MLVKPGDPQLFGLAEETKAQVANKAVMKRSLDEPAGVFVQFASNKIGVLEYSELTKTEAATKNYTLANIANHVFALDFVKKASSILLPYHLARKKVKGANDIAKDAFKLESFIFDAFPVVSTKTVLLVVDRATEFSPLKNGMNSAEDNPETCTTDLLRVYPTLK